ncbi:DUF6783 domain-containing protein [Ruminococcus sp. AM42-11]|uniref:DUF6783 domain-containing protein n=1 Tax=Ruminococcus sp. AM42-11 TaxID=2292372 RepID=UPI00325B03E3
MHAPLCGIFHPNSVVVARYDALIRAKSPTNCDAHLAESLFQTRSRMTALMKALLASDRMADVQLALDDPGYCEKLMEEYGIK